MASIYVTTCMGWNSIGALRAVLRGGERGRGRGRGEGEAPMGDRWQSPSDEYAKSVGSIVSDEV